MSQVDHDQAGHSAAEQRPRPIDLAGLPGQVGRHLGHSRWHEVTQDQVNRFANATGDHQWIHVDPQRAAEGPFGRTIAHGYLTLSLGPALLEEILLFTDAPLVVNYGLDRVRFPAPLPVGERLRLGVECAAAESFQGGVQVTLRLTFEVENQRKPACVADVVFRYYG